MRILVTGGTGFLGRALCGALTAKGYSVVVLSRTPDRVARDCGASVRGVSVFRDAGPVDAVINLAGAPILDKRWSPARKQDLFASRAAFTENMIRWLETAETRPSLLLSGSAVGYYGDGGDRELDENTPCGQDFAAHLCAEWEKAARHAADLGLRVCLLRTGLVLHPSGGLLHRLLTPFRLGFGGRIGDGRQWMSWIHRDDWVALVLRLLSDPTAAGAFNLTAPAPVTNARFTNMLGRVLHRPTPLPVPAPLLRGLLGERAQMLLTGQRAQPVKAEAMGFRFAYSDIEAALRALLS